MTPERKEAVWFYAFFLVLPFAFLAASVLENKVQSWFAERSPQTGSEHRSQHAPVARPAKKRGAA